MKVVFTQRGSGVFRVIGDTGSERVLTFNHQLSRDICTCNVVEKVYKILKEHDIDDRELAMEIARFFPWFGYEITIYK